ncbi:isochorismatase family protein [Methanomassiliicoccus luminyensis]|uniref:isochorismatase family protein n=1 Tax=Methanomassiliicoccus luminyensis TaxID=1080712 RepID=UPI000367900D|nr:isochorismatase family protein [Methanomassiliicoccus luminyensis]
MSRDLVIGESTALVVIDLQKGIAGDPDLGPYPAKEVIERSVRLMEAFRGRSIPVFLVRVELRRDIALDPDSDLPPLDPLDSPEGWADFVDEVMPAPTDIIVTKRQWGAFYGTDLDLRLRRLGVRTIIMCGIATNFGVEGTARAAYELGYDQIFAEDAMTSASKEFHDMSVELILKRLGKVRSTQEILAALRLGRKSVTSPD